MKGSWITDIRHFLDEEGTTSQVPPSVARLAEYFGSIVEAVSSQADNNISAIATGIRCRRRPGRKRCAGEIIACHVQQNALNIKWHCPVCGDNGIISGWQDANWDRR
jgi:hypothetical protein